MTELLLRDQFELQKRNAEKAEWERVASLQEALSVLKTRFDSWLERAVQGDDLKELKREMEAEMNKQIGHICEHFDSQITNQSRDLLNEFRGLLAAQQAQVTSDQLAQSNALLEAQRRTRVEIIRYGIGFALTIISALVIFWLTRNG